jgi:hypothetical protein
MCSATSFDVLSRVVEQYESRGGAVQRVEATPDGADGALDATLELPLALDGAGAVTPRTATLTDDGLAVEFTAADLVASPDAPAATVTDRTVAVVDDELLVTVELEIDPGSAAEGAPSEELDRDETAAPDGGAAEPAVVERPDTDDPAEGDAADDPATETADDPATEAPDESGLAAELDAVRDESVPPYEDTRYLRALYEGCETFTEMSRHIEMDVVAETVRRYMIDAGIHDPTPYDTAAATGGAADDVQSDDTAVADDAPTGGTADGPVDAAGTEDGPTGGTADESTAPAGTVDDGEATEEQLVADGTGLPDHLSVEEIVAAVADSATVYEVQRRLGLGQQRTRELLDQLHLLDLVLHRVDSGSDREVTREEVVGRIRRRAGT